MWASGPFHVSGDCTIKVTLFLATGKDTLSLGAPDFEYVCHKEVIDPRVSHEVDLDAWCAADIVWGSEGSKW